MKAFFVDIFATMYLSKAIIDIPPKLLPCQRGGVPKGRRGGSCPKGRYPKGGGVTEITFIALLETADGRSSPTSTPNNRRQSCP